MLYQSKRDWKKEENNWRKYGIKVWITTKLKKWAKITIKKTQMIRIKQLEKDLVSIISNLDRNRIIKKRKITSI